MSVVTITGSNDFARQQAVRQLVKSFVKAHGDLALERLDGQDHEFVRIREALTSLPFLANKKMVLLTSPASNSELAHAFEVLLDSVPNTTELVLVEPKFDKRSSLYKLLKKRSDFREYGPLDEAMLSNWIVQRAKDQGGSISSRDARYLIERVGRNQQLLWSELTKLLLRDSAISRLSIDEMTDAVPQSTIFELIDAAFSKTPAKALALYEEQRRLKVEPQQIIAMLAWQLHVLAVLCAAGSTSIDNVAATTGINAFTLRKSQRLAAKLSITVVRDMVDELLTIDVRSKREAIDLDEALKAYFLRYSV